MNGQDKINNIIERYYKEFEGETQEQINQRIGRLLDKQSEVNQHLIDTLIQIQGKLIKQDGEIDRLEGRLIDAENTLSYMYDVVGRD